MHVFDASAPVRGGHYRPVHRPLAQIEQVAGAHGVFNMSPNDHLGLDQRARVMVTIENGAWKLIK